MAVARCAPKREICGGISSETTLGNTSTPVRGFAAFLFALFLGYAGNSAAAPPPNPPNMTIKIFNDTNTNTPPHYIFPVLSAGAKSGSDMWLQAGLLVLQSQVGVDLYPRGFEFRFYINPTGGIAPGQKCNDNAPSLFAISTHRFDRPDTARSIYRLVARRPH